MNISALLSPKIQNFIIEKTNSDSSKLAFQKNPFPEIDFKIVINQIECRKKSKEKLPTWFNTPNIIYPSKISVEQTSSETTAKYKAALVSGENLIDLSGGFGVDDYYFSKKINHVTHCEINADLTEIVAHNMEQLKVSNITCIEGDSRETLLNLNKKFNWIYVDPSRRNDLKGKVFLLKDCLPNVPEEQEFYYNFSNNILIKTAPILDISSGIAELKNVKTIHIVAVDNEVKELLWEIEKNFSDEITIKTINFNKDKLENFDFKLNSDVVTTYGLPKKYLYEPNSAIMKSGGFTEIGNRYSLDKLHQHSHLYTSDDWIEFPGRVFEIQKMIHYSKVEMKSNLENTKANITTRNFPDNVEIIRKKWKIKDGGNDYCFFTTDKNDNKIVLICTKINL
jgi:THUMP domain-like/Conserved hypothetical protein 95